MYRRNLLRHLLIVIPASFIFPWRVKAESTNAEAIVRHRILTKTYPSNRNLSKLQLINAALGGEVEGDYRGFPYSWTGYKAALDNIALAGQWVTYSFTNRKPCFLHREGLISPFAKVGEPVFINSSAPGASGQYGRGSTFNINTQPWQEELTLGTPIEILAQEQAKALEVLQFEIDAYLDGAHKKIFNFRKIYRAGEANKPILVEHEISVNEWIKDMVTPFPRPLPAFKGNMLVKKVIYPKI